MNEPHPSTRELPLADGHRELDPATPAGRLHEAARLQFARLGFRAATTRGIAEAAGLNQALVHYYFGSKEALYRRVLALEIRRILAHQTEGRLGVLEPADFLATFPGRLVGWFRRHPEAAELLRREVGSGAVVLGEMIRDLGPHGPMGMRKRLHALARQGDGLPMPTDHALACLLSLSYGLVLIAPLLEAVMGLDLHKDAAWRKLEASLEGLLRRGLAPGREA